MQKIQKMANGVEIPSLGFGTFQIPDGAPVAAAVRTAVETGYTHFDCAAIYGNEDGVGLGLKQSGIEREKLFLTSKVWNDRQTFNDTLDAFQETLDRLGTDYLDLYLIHWPKPLSGECWSALEKLYEEKKVRAIGVCNFTARQLDELLATAKVTPMINQVELHPQFPQNELQSYCSSKNILVESWGPLMQGKIFSLPLMKELADKYNCSIAQLAVAWQFRQDNIALVKSAKPERIQSNFIVPEIPFTDEDLAQIAAIPAQRIGPDPENFDF